MNFDDFRSHILQIDNDKSKMWIYRGQANPAWALETTYSRFFSNNINSQNGTFNLDIFNSLLTRFIRRISEVFGTDYESYNLVRQMSLAQHYGIPTPLLDWSHSPFIAVYFAVTDALFHEENHTRFNIYALDVSVFDDNNFQRDAEERLNSNNSNPLEFIDTNRFFSKRIANQMGCFTFQNFAGGLEKWSNSQNNNSPELRKFTINGIKREITRELELMGIRGSSLFDDFDYVARDVINEELNRLCIG